MVGVLPRGVGCALCLVLNASVSRSRRRAFVGVIAHAHTLQVLLVDELEADDTIRPRLVADSSAARTASTCSHLVIMPAAGGCKHIGQAIEPR